jgi:glycosyltransferase involved in cell wall biosynthesis
VASSSPLKVLLVSTHPVQYAAPLYRRYAADPRVDVTVAYCSLQGAEPGMDPDFGVETAWDVPLLDSYRWVHPPNRSPRPGLRGFWGLINPGLWRIIRQGRFEVVVCYGYRAASFWIAALAAKRSGAALVLTTDAHNLIPRNGAAWKARFKGALLPQIFSLADGILVPSSRGVGFLRSLGLSPERIFLTPYVIDTPFFSARAAACDREAMRARWNIPPAAPVALFVGKLVPWKRPGDFLEAAARVEDLYAIFAGEGHLRTVLEARSAFPDLRGRVRFLGFTNQTGLPQIYAGCDVLVLPSEYEPFGLVVNEAFACGIPAVVSEACGAGGDLVRDGETGYVVPVGAVEELADRLRVLAADPGFRQTMGEKARSRIAEWGPGQNAEAFADACLTVAARR